MNKEDNLLLTRRGATNEEKYSLQKKIKNYTKILSSKTKNENMYKSQVEGS